MKNEFLPPETHFKLNNKVASLTETSRTVLDFWKWAYSDLLQNITRGYIAQFMVAWALGVDGKPNDPWRSYDVLSPDGKKIEVKSTAYLQAWDQTGKNPKPLFKLEPRLSWSETGGFGEKPEWNADIYVLAYFYWKDNSTADPTDVGQWKFWVFNKNEMVGIISGRKGITVSELENMHVSSKFIELKDAILKAGSRLE